MTIKSHTSVLASIVVTAILLIGCSQKNKEEISFTDIDSSISTALDGWNYKIEPSDLAQICDDVLNSSKNMLKKIEDDISNPTCHLFLFHTMRWVKICRKSNMFGI